MLIVVPIDVVWDSNHNLIKNNNVTSCSYAINLGGASYNSIFDNYLYDNHVGTWIRMGSRYNIFGNNTFSKNDNGIWVHSAQHNKIETNNISKSLQDGISVENAVNITVENNNISLNNGWGISLFATSDSTILRNDISNPDIGIRVRDSSNNVIKGNNITLNEMGVSLNSSSNNKIVSNNISGNLYGINLTSSSSNSIYHNLIADSTYQAYDDRFDNYWDNGYPSGGNYWSDYSGVDNFKGPNQDIPGSDGIGDSPYVIDADSQDNYPLMEPFNDKTLENFTILNDGWNLISILLVQSEQNLKKVLEMIDGFYDAVQWYDITDPASPWRHNRIGKPFGNDLFQINETMGFWVHITNPGDTIFLYNGTQPTSNQTIALHPGWNQVGFPSLRSNNRTVGLNNLTFGQDVDCIQWYDASDKTWHFMGPDDYFVPGRGYRVHSKVEAIWEVPL